MLSIGLQILGSPEIFSSGGIRAVPRLGFTVFALVVELNHLDAVLSEIQVGKILHFFFLHSKLFLNLISLLLE